jgi:hypothetical protein
MHTLCGTLAITPKECLLNYHLYYKHPNAVLIAVWSAYCRRVGRRKLSPVRVLLACGGGGVWRCSLLISALAGGVINFTSRLLRPEMEPPLPISVEYLSGYQGRSGHCRRKFPWFCRESNTGLSSPLPCHSTEYDTPAPILSI